MRFGRTLQWWALALVGCSGGYPLEPTLCDEWCDVTNGRMCPDYYNPASCVVQCEATNLDVERCRAELEAVLSCYRKTPDALTQACSYSPQIGRCADPLAAFDACITAQYLGPTEKR